LVLNSRNNGKYFHKRWEEDRNDAVTDKTGYTPAELAHLEVTGTEGTNLHQDEAYEIETDPIDPESSGKTIDIRLLPERGGNK
jgi:hypothetical protein